MDLVNTVRKEGSRGGRGDFKWSDVQADQHRENYLGHSLMAPVGRWQKGKDLQWYSRDKNSTNDEDDGLTEEERARRERQEEIARIKQAEREAMNKALGYEVNPDGPLGDTKGATGANATVVTGNRAMRDEENTGRRMGKDRRHKRRDRSRDKDHQHRYRRDRSRSLSKSRDYSRERHRRQRSRSRDRVPRRDEDVSLHRQRSHGGYETPEGFRRRRSRSKSSSRDSSRKERAHKRHESRSRSPYSRGSRRHEHSSGNYSSRHRSSRSR